MFLIHLVYRGLWGNPLPMGEDLIPAPEDPYGIAKFAVEQELSASHKMFGLNYVIFRPHNIYGERQNIGDPYRNVIGIFMNQIMQGKPLTIFGDGTQTRAFSYVRDIAPVIAQAHQYPKAHKQVLNIGAVKAFSLNWLGKSVCKAMEAKAEIVYLPARREVLHVNPTHAHRFKASEEGLSRIAAWAKKVRPCQGSAFSEIEIERGTPPSWGRLVSK